MILASRFTFGILLTAVVAAGCSGNGAGNNPGTGGAGGGAGGAGGGNGGAGGSSAGFMAFAPCTTESSYVATPTTITFGGTVGFNYSPQCLKVPAGTMVTFSGDFTTHPLAPSAMRGDPANNPIVNMSDGTTAAFTFSAKGFFAYLCNFHGTDDGAFMSGVIWVQ